MIFEGESCETRNRVTFMSSDFMDFNDMTVYPAATRAANILLPTPDSCDRDRGRVGVQDFSSSTGSAGPLPSFPTFLAAPINITSTTVKVCRPGATNQLVFTGIISIPQGSTVTIYFDVVRSINRGPGVSVGSTFTFSRTAGCFQSESFSFQMTDQADIQGAYTYSVQISPNSLLQNNAGVVLTNCTLSALCLR